MPIQRLIIPSLAIFTGLGTYTYLTIRDLSARYPLPSASSPSATNTLKAVVPAQTTLNGYLSHFYSTWTLRLEGVVARLGGLDPKTESFAGGIFVVTNRTDDSVTVQWKMPMSLHDRLEKMGAKVPFGGTQVLGCTNVQGGTEISYACSEDFGVGSGESEKEDDWAIWGHKMYMRYLFDSARCKLERDPK